MKRACPTILLTLVLAISGCQSAGGPQPAAAAAAREEFDLSTLKLVGFMGVAPGGTVDKLAVPVFEPLLERQLAASTLPFALISLQDVEAKARRQDLLEDFRAIEGFWRDQQKVDKLMLQRFCGALGMQGIIVGSLREWMQVEAAPNSDEASYTKISALLSVYEAESGRRVWRARASETVEAVQFQGDEDAVAREDPMGTGFVGGMRTGSDAPAVEDVAAKVVGELTRALIKGEQSD